MQADKPHEQRQAINRILRTSSFLTGFDLRTLFRSETSEEQKHTCKNCGLTFNNLQGLKTHVGRKHKQQ